MPIFDKQLIYTTGPSSALAEPQPDLVDSVAASGLMANHFGFGQWKVVFPGDVQFSAKACEVFGVDPTDETLPLEFLVQRFHPDDRGKLLKLFAATLQETRAFHAVLRRSPMLSTTRSASSRASAICASRTGASPRCSG